MSRNQHTARGQAVDQNRKQGPVQIVRDDDAIEPASGQGPWRPVFEIGLDSLHPGCPGQAGYVPVDGSYAMTETHKQRRVTAAAARHIEDGSTL